MRYNKGKEITKISIESHTEIYSKEYNHIDKIDPFSVGVGGMDDYK